MLNRKTAIASALAMLCTGAIAAPASLASLELGDNAAGVAFDPVLRYAFVTNYDDGTVSEIDVDSLAVTATIPAGDKPRRVVSDAVTHRIYYVNDTSPGAVTVVDTTLNGIVAKIEVGDRPRNIAADFQKGEVYVSNRDSNSLSVIDASTNRVIATVETGRNPAGIDVDTKLRRIYVPSGADGTVTIIDQNTHAVLQVVSVGRNPGGVTVDERSGKAYVNNVDDRTISVLDSEGAIVTTLAGGAGSTFGTMSAVYHRYYLPNATDGTLTIVDTDHDVVSSTLHVGASPQQAIVDAVAGHVYVANRGSNDVTVVDASTESVIGTFGAGVEPSRIAQAMGKIFVLNDNGALADRLTVAAEAPSADPTAIVTEYLHNASGHYFHSADPLETRLLGDGLFGDAWNRTMEFWRVWLTPGPDRVPVCRFYGAGLSDPTYHEFSPFDSDCAALMTSSNWQYEGTSYYVSLPGPSGACAAGTAPLYRLREGSPGDTPNDRFTTSPLPRTALQSEGWSVKGTGPAAVFACIPDLRAPGVAANFAIQAHAGQPSRGISVRMSFVQK